MALTGIQIFQKLPKTNCKECNFPTCLAFAMKLAAKQATLDDCPHMSAEARGLLEESAAPPIRKTTIGVGDNAIVLGEETVLFRHEKTFVHPCGLALNIKDTEDDAKIDEMVAAVNDSAVERVGQQSLVTGEYLNRRMKTPREMELVVYFSKLNDPVVKVVKHTEE